MVIELLDTLAQVNGRVLPEKLDIFVYIAAWGAASTAFWSLAERIEASLSAEGKKALGEWIAPKRSDLLAHDGLPAPRQIALHREVERAFVAVFGAKPLSLRFFARSAMLSVIFGTCIVLGFFSYAVEDVGGVWLIVLLGSFTVAAVFNIPTDYLSLILTRWVLLHLARRNSLKWLLLGVAIDLVGSVFISLTAFGTFLFIVDLGEPNSGFWAAYARAFKLFFPGSEGTSIARGLFLSSMLSSAWLWLFAIASVMSKALSQIRAARSAFAKYFDLTEKPLRSIAALGQLVIAAVFAYGATKIWS